jgi:hypothetical protein
MSPTVACGGREELRAERRAAPKPVRIPSGDRRTPSDEGLHDLRAERRAAAKPVRIPSGDRRTPSDEGPS